MTVNSSPSFILYAGDGVSTVMPVPFYVQKDADIYAVKYDANTLDPVQLVLNTDYTVQNAGSQSGAQLTLTAAIPIGSNLYIDRSNIVVDQQADYVQNDKFPSQVTEDAFDKLTMLMQLLKNASTSAIRYPTFEFKDGTLPPADVRAGNLLGFDGAGAQTLVPIGTSIGAGDLRDDVFVSGTDFTPGTTTQLTLSREYGTVANILIHFDTEYQGPDQVESLVGTTLTFTEPIPVSVSRVYVKGGTTVSAFVPSTGSITDDMVAENAGIDSSKLSFLRPEPGAVRIPAYAKFLQTTHIKEFGASFDPDADDTAAWMKVLADFQPETVRRGVKLLLPEGYSKVGQAMDFTSWSQLHEIIIEGEGPARTIVSFETAAPGTHGFTFNTGAYISLRDLTVFAAPGRGVWFGRNNPDSSPGSNNFFSMDNVVLQSCGTGLKVINSWMGAFRDVWVRNNLGNGVEFDGFFTSMLTERFYSSDNAGIGCVINGGIYSNFTMSCDSNGSHGFALSNIRSVNFVGCGGESNKGALFHIVASSDSVSSIPSNVQDVHGVTVIGCYGINNSLDNPGSFGGFMEVATTEAGRNIDIKIIGGSSKPATSSDRAIIASAASGSKIVIHKELFDDTGYTTSDFISGPVEVKNATVSGRYTSAILTAATQSIPNNTLTKLSISVLNDDLGITVSGGTDFVIGRGTNKIRIYASAGFDANGTGVRQVQVLKNGAIFNGGPSATVNAVVSGGTVLPCSASPIPVVEGDTFSFQVLQSSGAPLDVVRSTSTYFTIEAVS